jgi:hypothetical protein
LPGLALNAHRCGQSVSRPDHRADGQGVKRTGFGCHLAVDRPRFSLARKCDAWKVAPVMNLETYWLVIAPALLFTLSAVAWAGLWITRHREKPDHPPTVMKPLR